MSVQEILNLNSDNATSFPTSYKEWYLLKSSLKIQTEK